MNTSGDSTAAQSETSSSKIWERFKRALSEFLAIPSIIVLAFLGLAIISFGLDRSAISWIESIQNFVSRYLFTSAQATSSFVGTLAGGAMTITSITISMLLLALQQSASSMGTRVFDQFVQRRRNQVFFGLFVGFALYTVIVLATTSESFNPVISATLVLVFAALVLYLLVIMLYTTINQMRAEVIIESVHDETVRARQQQLSFIKRTRRSSRYQGVLSRTVKADQHGFVTHIDLSVIDQAIRAAWKEVEVVLEVSLGTFIARQDVLAVVKAATEEDAEKVSRAIPQALTLERQRSLQHDAAYGIEQLEMIGWTSISTANSQPEPGLLVLRYLRNILSQWVAGEEQESSLPPVPVVYRDNTLDRVMDTIASLAVVSSESMQFQNYAEVVRTIAMMFGRLPPDLQERAEKVVLRILSAMGDHVLTGELEETLLVLIETLETAGRFETAEAVRSACNQLAQSLGELNARSTRATAGKSG